MATDDSTTPGRVTEATTQAFSGVGEPTSRVSSSLSPSVSDATAEGIVERAEHIAGLWERGRYGDKTLRLRAEDTAKTLRDLVALVSPSVSGAAVGEPTCTLCGDVESKHTKSPADWRNVPGCARFMPMAVEPLSRVERDPKP